MSATGLDEDANNGRHVVSYSELDTFRQCPLKHNLGYQQRWTKPAAAGGALAKGTLWHAVLEEHHKVLMASQYNGKPKTAEQRAKIAKVVARRVRPLLADEDGNQSDTQELIAWMFEGYLEQWATDDNWKILGVEHQIVVNLPDEEGKPSLYDLKVKIDLLIQDMTLGSIWVVDNKSCANLPHDLEMELDDQFGLYVWAMKRAGRQVQGALHSAARTTRNAADHPRYEGKSKPQPLAGRFKRTLLTRTPTELTNIALDAFRAAQAAYPPPGMVRSLYSSPDVRQCGWKCDFKTAHLMMRTGGKTNQTLLDLGFRVDRTRH